jgi:hypothetical protein
MKIYVHKDNQQQGPFDETEVDDGLKSGLYSPTDKACREGMNDWQPLEKLFPAYGLSRLVSHATKIIGVSAILVTLMLIFNVYSYTGTDEAVFQLIQISIIFALHLVCLIFLFNASKNVNLAITGMVPGTLWNLGITLFALATFGDRHARSVNLASCLLLDYWWLSNLIRFLRYRKVLSADKERRAQLPPVS